MKVISPIFSSMRGRLGGAVGSVARGGVAYLRALVIPGNPRSFFQTTTRLILTALSAAWRSTLTDLQRDGWETVAGETSSGIDAYVQANSIRLLRPDPRVDDPPASLALVTSPTGTPVVDASAHTITFSAAVPADIGYSVFMSRPQSSSRLSRQFNYTYVATADETDTFVTLTADHPGFNLVAGDVVYVRIVQYGRDATNEGQTAPAQEFRCIVVV